MSMLAIRGTLTAMALALSAAAAAQDADASVEASNAASAELAGGEVIPHYGDINPFYGDINPFYGDINPFYGDINPFYGDINPFYGDIDPFYGNIDPFYGNINPFYGDINPFYGNINPFWGDIDPFHGPLEAEWGNIDPFWGTLNPLWGDIDPFWGNIDPFWQDLGAHWRETQDVWNAFRAAPHDEALLTELTGRMNEFVAKTGALWGERFAADGIAFETDFVAKLFSDFGLDLNDPMSLAQAGVARREAFMLAWYDGVMAHTGRDRVDHWMATANWRPSITQVQGSGERSIIGLLDATITDDPDLLDNLGFSGGYEIAGEVTGEHGASVASLMVAAHDNRGVMGIAPNAGVVAYNPFDETGTADWDDVSDGIDALSARGASIMNMSLGKSGWTLSQNWSDVFSEGRLRWDLKTTVFVKAAGNAGIGQSTDLDWTDAGDPALILVGSVDPYGIISNFSNRPGDACLLTNGICGEGDRLMDRFIVAPGEMILMSDGKGGTVRRSGTSFAAPIVSGTIALMHDRWPWLKWHPDETAEVIFKTAKDLGEPGVDAVYGHGLLDIEASQSPIDYGALVAGQVRYGRLYFTSLEQSRVEGTLPTWTSGAEHLHLFELIGDTWRDFLVPLSTSLYGKTKDLRFLRYSEYYQDYLVDEFNDWWNEGAALSDVRGFRFDSAGFAVEVKGTPVARFAGTGMPTSAAHTEVDVAGLADGLTVRLGHGLGAMALTTQQGFGLTRDYREGETGLNPILGFASGGAFAAGLYEISPFFTVFGGITETHVVHDRIDGLDEAQRAAYRELAPYDATGISFGFHFTPVRNVTINAAYSRLDEKSAILGVQSQNDEDLRGGSHTDALTIGMDARLGEGISFAVSATGSRTGSADTADRKIDIAAGGVVSTAFAASLSKHKVLNSRDIVRFKLEQPLHIEKGALTLTQAVIVDRRTGDIGNHVSTFGIDAQSRPLNAELLYASPLGGSGEVSVFTRAETNINGVSRADALSAGGRIRIAF